MGQTKIVNRLDNLQKDMNYIKEHIEDTTLTEKDLKSIQ